MNDQFAINLLAEEPVVVINDTHTWCDGGIIIIIYEIKFIFYYILLFIGGDALGHPKVYINLDKPEIGVCGYCGKSFVSSQNKHLFPEEA